MKAQLLITAFGEAGTGKTVVVDMVQKFLEEKGFVVVQRNHAPELLIVTWEMDLSGPFPK